MNHRQPYFITKSEAATQTYGIYYPSVKDLEYIKTQNQKLLDEKEIQEHRPLFKSISPGNGYWRQQLDHVYAHLKVYAANQPDFQLLIGNN